MTSPFIGPDFGFKLDDLHLDVFDFDDSIPKVLNEAVRSKRFLAASRSRLSMGEIATWDKDLVRELRLLVPIDLQALFVEPGSDEDMVRLPMLLSEPEGVEIEESMPEPFSKGSPRESGVHLHWAMPDALLRGRMEDLEAGDTTQLGLPPLPDRWLVLRVALPNGESRPHLRGWVLEADRAIARPLTGWTEKSESEASAVGVKLDPNELTGTVGGSPAWAGVYDAVKNRFAFHDPLEDLGDIAPKGVDRDSVAYLVTGWWSDPGNDPLDQARSVASIDELLHQLRWRLLPEWGDSRYLQEFNDSLDQLRGPLGFQQSARFDRTRAASTSESKEFTPIVGGLTARRSSRTTSRWATDSFELYETDPWHLRSSLLHGAVYGVPTTKQIGSDRRPGSAGIRVALGEHDGDVVASLATIPGVSARERRHAERLLEAFASQRINRLGSADGLVDIESEEHAGGFASIPGGIAGTDRFTQRVEPGKAGGFTAARSATSDIGANVFTARNLGAASQEPAPAAAQQSQAVLGSSIQYAENKYDLTALDSNAVLSQQWERRPITLPATESRVVDRPAPRFNFPADPMVAVQGAGRSLRHANDGRASADGKLTCRWPTQIADEKQGVVDGADLISTLDNASVPAEALSLARELLVHDPYHLRWLAQTAAPALGFDSSLGIAVVHERLVAETAIRFGTDAVYDGSTQAFAGLDAARSSVPRGRPGRAGLAESDISISSQHQQQVSDQLLSFSLAKGADPDPVGVTCWSQPWVPTWLEWEAVFDPPEAPSLDGWELGSVDMDPVDTPPGGPVKLLVGRALLTTGAATTLSRAITDWLAAEDQRDAADPASGEADEATEAALASLARAVDRPDIMTAAMDGFRTELLGIPSRDGMVTRVVDGEVIAPEPVEQPKFLVGGRVRLKRARLVDAWGRTLEVPIDDVETTVRDSIKNDAGALSFPPRLTRPARWRFQLVDAATPVETDGVEARVDQIDPTLQVNPVAGFLLPDHLDESLEFFSANGEPVGELLAESVGGGVVWEMAPGREGPPSSGPRFGLDPAQQVLGSIAVGVVAADGARREGRVATEESALAAWLRAIDTTLWTVDTFASLGSEHVAGLVGRPIAVVRAQLRLELAPPSNLDLSDPDRANEWSTEAGRLASIAFPVRIGELTRTDDGVIGFFVNDDYTRFRPVDKVVAELAAEGGRSRGHLGIFGRTPSMPSVDPITHPFVVGSDPSVVGDSDTLHIHLGQTITLTLLMNPAGRAYLTSGVLPRTSIALARDWVGPGLAAVSPSLRTGPLIVETDTDADGQVRLPKVAVFGKDQDLWFRDTPAVWRNDAILAATQTAMLPETPAAVREGWIRVRPTTPDGPDNTGGGAGS